MAFNDDEMSTLKQSLQVNKSVGPKVVKAVLERMEAAEGFITATWAKVDLPLEAAEAWNAWRKAAGR